MPLGCAPELAFTGSFALVTLADRVETALVVSEPTSAASPWTLTLFFVAILLSCGLEFDIGTTYPSNNPLDFWGANSGGCKKTT